jgi:hypothetical protein
MVLSIEGYPMALPDHVTKIEGEAFILQNRIVCVGEEPAVMTKV